MSFRALSNMTGKDLPPLPYKDALQYIPEDESFLEVAELSERTAPTDIMEIEI